MKPLAIQGSRSEKVLRVEWDDGHASVYPWHDLRQTCPCADCRSRRESEGESAAQDPLSLPLVQEGKSELAAMEQVGNYGLKLVWKDGHDYGIYSWELLRSLCPCGAHAAVADDEPAA